MKIEHLFQDVSFGAVPTRIPTETGMAPGVAFRIEASDESEAWVLMLPLDAATYLRNQLSELIGPEVLLPGSVPVPPGDLRRPQG